ncbi:hypothetical protein F4779DRAFT_614535 [Xylariaceae sp. FL0662B]|nr:hypothetical protein F4779DRAFT_614535 [Xylariaceae sp. FL0662B]
MAFRLLPYRLSFWVPIWIGFASSIELGDDIKRFVPACAQPCLVSFIEGNYPSTGCTSNPSLQCLCAERSISGYTVGEGALECVAYELDRGGCGLSNASGEDTDLAFNLTADTNIVLGLTNRDAYLMCSGVANALPNTHAVLTATIATGPSGAVSVIPPPTGTNSQSSTASNTVPTSTGYGTITTFPTPVPPTVRPTATSTTVNPSVTSMPTSTSTTSLTTAQIAGIVVGVVGAIGIALGAIFLARRIRGRRYPDTEDGLLPMDQDRRGSGPYGPQLTGALSISPPISRFSSHQWEPRPPRSYHTSPPHIQTPPIPRTPPNRGFSPGLQLSPNPDRETIGLAISRPLNASPAMSPDVPTQRRSSRLLPAKPALSLKIPPPPPPPPNAAVMRSSSSQAPHIDRASTMTNVTVFADVDTEAPDVGQVWRPPPSDPQSATAVYVVDRRGNWVLSNNRESELAQVAEAAELDTYTPLTKSPQEKREEAAARAAAVSAATSLPKKPPPTFLSRDPVNRGSDRSSSLYSQASAVPHNLRGLASRSNSSRSRRGQINRSDTKMSHDSVTTINSAGSFDDVPPFGLDETHSPQLSTVIEASPALGRSPVSYPKIPGRLNRSMMQRTPPRQPNFTNSAVSPPGQESPTLGAVELDDDSDSAYPPPLNPRRSQVAEAQSRIRGFNLEPRYQGVDLTPTRAARRDYVQPQIQSSAPNFSPGLPSNPRLPRRFQTPPMQTSGSGFSPNPPNVETFVTPSPQPSRPDTTGERLPHTVPTVSPLSQTTMSSGTSSLLAKRLGNDRAVALALDPKGKKRAGQWKLQGGQNGMLSPDAAGIYSPGGTLPQTPSWQPKLTPTRRGDDLYLKVQ